MITQISGKWVWLCLTIIQSNVINVDFLPVMLFFMPKSSLIIAWSFRLQKQSKWWYWTGSVGARRLSFQVAVTAQAGLWASQWLEHHALRFQHCISMTNNQIKTRQVLQNCFPILNCALRSFSSCAPLKSNDQRLKCNVFSFLLDHRKIYCSKVFTTVTIIDPA